jgi:hypothetical protein
MQVLKMMSCKVSVDPFMHKASVDTDKKPFSTDWTLAEMISTTKFLLGRKLLLRFLEDSQVVGWTNDGEHQVGRRCWGMIYFFCSGCVK